MVFISTNSLIRLFRGKQNVSNRFAGGGGGLGGGVHGTKLADSCGQSAVKFSLLFTSCFFFANVI